MWQYSATRWSNHYDRIFLHLGLKEPLNTPAQDMDRTCSQCEVVKQSCDFEGTRKVCRPCRTTQRKKKQVQAKEERQASPAPQIPTRHRCTVCDKTPLDGAVFGLRTDCITPRWKSLCHVCFREKRYDEVYRKREREKNEDAYKTQNAKRMMLWREINKDHWKGYTKMYMQTVNGIISSINTSARQRDIFFDTRDEELFKELVKHPCWYCGNSKTSLDRLDSNLGYTRTNVVACCSPCNFMKRDSSVSSFLDRAALVAKNHATRIASINPKSLDSSTGMGNRNTPNPNPERKMNMLSAQEKDILKDQPCYLCDGPGGGIDRIDSSTCYRPDNCAGCCSLCNYMKKDYTLEFFLYHVHRVQAYSFGKPEIRGGVDGILRFL